MLWWSQEAMAGKLKLTSMRTGKRKQFNENKPAKSVPKAVLDYVNTCITMARMIHSIS